MSYKSARLKISDHINKVRLLMTQVIGELWQRYNEHDLAKLQEPEFSAFARAIPDQGRIVYGSPEYHAAMEPIREAIQHHYRHSRHHPEHHINGVNDMHLVDLAEMICDWMAASRSNNLGGSFGQSLEINAKRFKMSDQLVRIFENTAKWLEECEKTASVRSASGRGG